MLRRVALVKTDVSEKTSTSVVKVTRTGELGTTLAVTSNRRTLRRNTVFGERKISKLTKITTFLRSMRLLLVTANFPVSLILVTLMMEALRSSETSVLSRSILRNIPENAIF
jgi:hypothetical protein